MGVIRQQSSGITGGCRESGRIVHQAESQTVEEKQTGATAGTGGEVRVDGQIAGAIRLIRSRAGVPVPVVFDLSIAQMLK
jgi:uncharacterized metal-binding protein YceD (DUF177 family)